MRIYLDSAPIVYLVEQNPSFSPMVVAKLATLGGDLVSSELARMEALVLPYRIQDQGLIQDFEDFFSTQLVEIAGVHRAVFTRAARVRAQYPFKTPDAIHLATAIVSGCDIFVTNDHRLQRFTGIRIEVV